MTTFSFHYIKDDCVQRLFSLFIQGDISESLKQGSKDNAFLKRKIIEALRGIVKHLQDKDIEVSILEAKFSIKHKR